MLAPEVRSQFAKRLKTMRTQRGFDRARYFARSLGIEENRYTRYERAEVEPSLTLIHKMCETLRVSPNELLGFADLEPGAVTFEPAPGLAEGAAGEIVAGAPARWRRVTGRTPSARWPGVSPPRRWPSATSKRENPRPRATRCETMRETGALFRSLQAEPFETAAELAADPALERVDGKRRAALAGLIRSYTDSISETRPARTRSR